MPFNATTSACAARASIIEAKRKEKQEEKSKEAEAQMKNKKYQRKKLLTMGLRRYSVFGAKPIDPGVEILDSPKDPNAQPGYLRPTAISLERSGRNINIKKGGRRTRKRRNGKKKTMRKGGRMRKGGGMRKSGMRRRRYS